MPDLWLERFRKECLPRLTEAFKPEKVMIFGSRVKGEASEDSDIDVILVSDYFANIPFLKRMPLVLKKVPFQRHVDYICYTNEEFERLKNESSVIMDALDNSIELVAQAS